jgi:hypothetical protein
LQLATEDSFSPEWSDALPALTDLKQQGSNELYCVLGILKNIGNVAVYKQAIKELGQDNNRIKDGSTSFRHFSIGFTFPVLHYENWEL